MITRSPPNCQASRNTRATTSGRQYSGTGADSYTVDFESKRNGAYGPGFCKFDVRLGYQLRMGTRRIDLFGEIFNVPDRVNFANPTEYLLTSDF